MCIKNLCKLFKKVSLKVIKGQQRSRIAKKGQKDQISNFILNTHIRRQNEALGLTFSRKIVSRSFKVIQRKESPKKFEMTNLIKIGWPRNSAIFDLQTTSFETLTTRASFWRMICTIFIKLAISFFLAFFRDSWPLLTFNDLEANFLEILHKELHFDG